MTRTRWQVLAAVAVLTLALGALVVLLIERTGGAVPEVPWTVCAVVLLLAGIVLRMGWAVRAYLDGKKPDLDPIRAARTAVLAKAASFTGSLLLGWYAAQVVMVLDDLEIESLRRSAVAAGLAALSSLVLAVVGLVVEGFCRLPPPDAQDEREADGEPTVA